MRMLVGRAQLRHEPLGVAAHQVEHAAAGALLEVDAAARGGVDARWREVAEQRLNACRGLTWPGIAVMRFELSRRYEMKSRPL